MRNKKEIYREESFARLTDGTSAIIELGMLFFLKGLYYLSFGKIPHPTRVTIYKPRGTTCRQIIEQD